MSIDVFQYPKSKHTRTLKPRQFKRYQSYKRYLQKEFSRVCVYCRQPDSSAPNLNFGVDHYRPKSITRFANLVCDYSNLYYCCSNCNSRKNNHWPKDERIGPYIVAPCDHEMAKHLRFSAETGKISTHSTDGTYTEELLQLNDPTVVQFRRTTVSAIKLANKELASLAIQKKEIAALLKNGKIDQATHDTELQDINREIEEMQTMIQDFTGSKPTAPLAKTRLGLDLH